MRAARADRLIRRGSSGRNGGRGFTGIAGSDEGVAFVLDALFITTLASQTSADTDTALRLE